MTDQLMILAQQNRRLRRLRDNVEWIITDSPIPLGLAYCQGEWTAPWFHQTVRSVFQLYDNINFRIVRVKPYQAYGRSQAEDEARALDGRVQELLRVFVGDNNYEEVNGDVHAPQAIFDLLMKARTVP